MNDILKNEEFLEKLEDRILDKLSDKVVESIISDKDFAPYLGHEEDILEEAIGELETKPSRGKAGVERFLQHKLSASAEEVIEKLRSLSPADKIPSSAGSIDIERTWEGFIEKEKSSKKENIAPAGTTDRLLSDLESEFKVDEKKDIETLFSPSTGIKSSDDIDNKEKIEEKMNSFEDKIVKIIKRGGLDGITNLTEFYDTVDSILRRTEKVNTIGYGPTALTPKERDSLNSRLIDARALSAFNRLSEAAAGELLLSRIRDGKFSLLQVKDGYTTTSRIVFDEGEATLIEYCNTVTAHRFIKVSNFFLFEKLISDFQFSSDKAMEVWEILENRKNITILEHQKLNSEYESKRLNPKERIEEVCKQVEFMSPEFLQAIK